MNKGRVEAFTDAIVAIIMTIMALEIKIPHGPNWSALLQERTYFLAYFISFFLIATTWYNHHYLFVNAKNISRKGFWANMLWLFFMSFAPVGTGWISEEPKSKAAAYFYLLMYLVWGITFHFLAKVLADDNSQNAGNLKQVNNAKRLLVQGCLLALGAILINWWPITILLILGIDVLSWIFASPKTSSD
jgi:uncharacterized membrane protein